MNFDLESIELQEMLIRLGLAAIAGLVMGLDRDIKNKPVDFRAYMIVCTASALLAIVSMEIVFVIPEQENFMVDPNRIVQGILTGIGFLGAGAIIHTGQDHVVGTATGASIWASGSLGLCIGYGFYALAFATFILIAFILVVLGWLRRKFVK